MKHLKKITALLYMAVFGLAVLVPGVCSAYKLGVFYISDTLDYNEWSPQLGSRFETNIASTFFGKFDFVTLNGGVRRLLGQHEMNGVTKLNNGSLASLCEDAALDSVREKARQIADLNAVLAAKGIPLLYVVTPSNVSPYDPQLPTGTADGSNRALDEMAALLRAAGVETLDIRGELHADGIDQYTMMYRTDHHWTTRCGFYAFNKICARLEQALGCTVDARVKDITQYEIRRYPNWHLGSNGQRVGTWFAGSDDFELFLPRFDTTLVRDGVSGPFAEMAVGWGPLQNKDVTSRYTYDYVLNPAASDCSNPAAANDKKLLVVADSFGNAVAPFLDLAFAEVRYDYQDYRAEQKSRDAYQPDAVVVILHVTNVISQQELDLSALLP